MIKNMVIVSILVSSYLLAMGDSINYDDKFNNEEQQELNANSKANNLLDVKLESFILIEKDGKNIPVKRVKRNSKVVYINRVVNGSNTSKRDIVVKNPIPQGVEYVIGSAVCQDGCTISYSTNGGNTLVQKESYGEIYNYIEFHFSTIPPQKEFRMGFRAIVK